MSNNYTSLLADLSDQIASANHTANKAIEGLIFLVIWLFIVTVYLDRVVKQRDCFKQRVEYLEQARRERAASITVLEQENKQPTV